MKIRIFSGVFLIFFWLIFPEPSFASKNFTTDYHITYSVKPTGQTQAILNGTLTNTSSDFYASSYKIQVGFDSISNIRAGDALGSINPVIEKKDKGYEITLQFNQKSVGLGNKLNFHLTFDTPEVAKKFGKIWEINIPGIANPNDFNDFSVQINVPQSFGKAEYIKPAQSAGSLTFNKEQLGKSGISILFGNKQSYTFHLIYHIKNDKLYPVKTEIALPPDTNYQEVYIENINPKPSNVVLDGDGNWLAQYSLLPSQSKTVIVDGVSEISLSPKTEELSPQDKEKYLEEKKYWEVNSREIKSLANELKTPEAIYAFVLKALRYDYNRSVDNKPRLGALGALDKPDSAMCLEYTDLFIAIARAAGIPSREIDGFAYTQESKMKQLSLVKDVLHVWPEYYNFEKKAWIMIDPTWGGTTGGIDYFSSLDLDHFAFVIRGMDSDYPVPAGGYKLATNNNIKDVTVNFSQISPKKEYNFNLSSQFPKYIMSGMPLTGKITIKNINKNLLDSQDLIITSQTLKPPHQAIKTSPIPPYGYIDINSNFNKESFLTNKIESFTIQVKDQTISQSVDVSTFMIKKWWLIGGGIVFGLSCIVIFIITIKKRRL